jgi:leucyl/phenylalanyl-tRNA--protein transferase
MPLLPGKPVAPVLAPADLVRGYLLGRFPMANSKRAGAAIRWYYPRLRGVIPLDGFRLTKNTARTLRRLPHELRLNTAFVEVMQQCANTRPTSWINPSIITSYTALHHLGLAHSVEIWEGSALTGGLYGVAIGGAFFGESMFRLEPERDKLAVWQCWQLLRAGGFTLWDTQLYTEHLGRTFGCIEIPHTQYIAQLGKAVEVSAQFGPFRTPNAAELLLSFNL